MANSQVQLATEKAQLAEGLMYLMGKVKADPAGLS